MDGGGRFLIAGACGCKIEFSDLSRGEVAVCRCGHGYRVPQRASLLGRGLGRVRWALRWLTARRPGPDIVARAVPYREGRARVSCPSCRRVPTDDDRWQCEFCYCSWNTFATGGRCPGCGFGFPATWCPGCNAQTRHRDWYQG